MKWPSNYREFLPTAFILSALVGMHVWVPQIRSLFPTPNEQADIGRPLQLFIMSWMVAGVFIFAFFLVITPVTVGKLLAYFPQPFGVTHIGQFIQRKRDTLLTTPCAVLFIAAILAVYFDPAIINFVFLFTVVWIFYFAIARRWFDSPVNLLWRVLFAATVLGLMGEALWIAGLYSKHISTRLYSVGATCYISFLIAIIVASIDRWQTSRPEWPVRLCSLIVCALTLMFFMKSPTIGSLVITGKSATDSDVVTIEWLESLERRIDQADENFPLIIISASGGGSRAALFATMIYEGLQEFDDQVNLASKNEVSNGASDFHPEQQVILISSVSGGSLATACYTDPAYRKTRRVDVNEVRNYYFDSMTRMMHDEILKLQANKDFQAIHDKDVMKRVFDACKNAREEIEKPDGYRHSFLHRQFIDDMCSDFMAPLIRGMIQPRGERGEIVTEYWHEHFGLTDTPQDVVQGDAPLWMSNSTDVNSGRPFVVGFPPVNQDFITPKKLKLVALNRSIADWSLTRAEAVRLSANFPWGFELATSPLKVIRQNTAGIEMLEPLKLVDGAVFDNTGVTVLRSMIYSIKTLASDRTHPDQLTPNRRRAIELAKTTYKKMTRQGVIMLEIDSGAKPEQPGLASKTFPSLLDPINSLSNATIHTSERGSLDNIKAMQVALRNPEFEDLKGRLTAILRLTNTESPLLTDLSSSQIENFFHIKATCNEEDNVMTAWTLPPEDKAKIFVRSMVAIDELRSRLKRVLAIHRETRGLTKLIAERIAVIENDFKQNRSGDLGSLNNLASGYKIVADIVENLQIEQEERQALDQLFATQGTEEQYAKTKEEFTQRRAQLATSADSSIEKYEQMKAGRSATNRKQPSPPVHVAKELRSRSSSEEEKMFIQAKRLIAK